MTKSNESSAQELYNISVSFENYSKEHRSVIEPYITKSEGTSFLTVLEPNGKVTKYNLSYIHRYDYIKIK